MKNIKNVVVWIMVFYSLMYLVACFNNIISLFQNFPLVNNEFKILLVAIVLSIVFTTVMIIRATYVMFKSEDKQYIFWILGLVIISNAIYKIEISDLGQIYLIIAAGFSTGFAILFLTNKETKSKNYNKDAKLFNFR